MPPSTSPFTEGSCSANGFACQHVPHPSRGEHERSTRKDGAVCSSDPDGEDVTRSSSLCYKVWISGPYMGRRSCYCPQRRLRDYSYRRHHLAEEVLVLLSFRREFPLQ
ncbi:hypothetical protein HBI56_018150 [Parastagonospora nodorum]|uniref:Uncharacterized protein n=1 Tax=Phaeosphaeria nodorum (strain SN15 / ATCC MYA-4574 / FGSC 10173) TaxID=321614 RepID=A0A7U2F0Z5_PHANO|nr:hypothetical protein HBH56_081840 [Parastagonospora nodorum]QRC96617.1 hypothetical protein JI435_015200 [Parastagonospora nodorum SN15]KAH3929952.1 hypothetical protein HBH54_120000 [Parastagonospora nodorum]KAH3982534.1 hypothetical protein HBH52_077460 [Parastagonospora nodorum]KAH4041021.1 hypothetical protein HBI09_017030 [Parastagonospora nodorum]